MGLTQITLDGITISVEKKKIKNIYIRVLPPDGQVKITAPRFVSDETLLAFAGAKSSWIKTQQAKVLMRHSSREPEYITGEHCELWGQPYPLTVLDTNLKSDVCLLANQIVLRVRRDSTAEQRARVMNEWYRQQLKATVPAALERCQQVVGVSADAWNVKNMRTRWGTCNIRQRRIWLNLQLVKKPPQCLDYVITHELVHLLEPSHNHVFKHYMGQFYPNWKAVKALLNRRLPDCAMEPKAERSEELLLF